MSFEIPSDYDQVTFQQGQKLVKNNAPEDFGVSLDFFNGDHWQGGDGWPHAIDPQADGAAYLQSLIEEMFESKNIVGEVVTRYLDGLFENTPEVGFAAPDEAMNEDDEVPDDLASQIDTANGVLTRWMREKELVDEAREAVKYAALGGRGYLRPYIPRGRRDERGRLSGSWEDVMRDVYVTAVKPTNAVIFQHPDTGRKLSVFHFEPGETLDIKDPNERDDRERVELGWVDPDTGETVIRILNEGESPGDLRDTTVETDDGGEVDRLAMRQMRIDLDGHLLLQEIDIDQLITEQVRSSQRSFNLTKTMQTHNEISSGFSERVFFNAQPPGEFQQKEGGGREWVPNEFTRGPFRTHFIQGTETTDEMGNPELEDPSMQVDEADDPEVYLKGKRSKRKDILDEVSQTFVLMNETTEASGRSRLIARHEFTKTLNKAVSDLTEILRGATMSVTIMAETFGEGSANVRDLDLPVEVYPDSGPLTPSEMKALDTMTESGLMSMQTALSRAGIHDIEAEMQRIKEEESTRTQRLIERAQLIKELVAAGSSLPGAAQVAGFTEEEARKLQTGFDGNLAQAVSETANGNPR